MRMLLWGALSGAGAVHAGMSASASEGDGATLAAVQSLSSDIYASSRETDRARELPATVPVTLDARVAALHARLDSLRRDARVAGIDTGTLARKLRNLGFLLGNLERARADATRPMQRPLVPDHRPLVARSTFAQLDARRAAGCEAALGLTAGGEVDGVLEARAELWLHVEVAAGTAVKVDTAATSLDTEIAVFDACPAKGGVPITINDDAFGLAAAVVLHAGDRHRSYRLRVRNLGAHGELAVVAGAGGAIVGHIDWSHFSSGAEALAIDPAGFYVGNDYSLTGDYSLSLEPGNYYVVASANANVARVWPNVECGSSYYIDCAHAPAQPVAVQASTTTNGIDFVLDAGARVSGRVRDAVTGLPIAGASVQVYGDDFPTGWDAWTDSVGRFSVETLAAGNYHAMVAADRYLVQLFDRLDCPLPQTCGAYDGAVIHLAHGQVFGQADFPLREAPFVRAVVHAPPSWPGAYAYVVAFDAAGVQVVWQYADFEHPAEIGPLAPGAYHFVAYSQAYVSQAYDHIDCASDCLAEVATATAVTVAQGGTEPSIAFDLHPMPAIRGTVTDAGSGDGLAGAVVTLFGTDGFPVNSTATTVDGTYSLQGVPSGTYWLVITSIDHRDTAYVAVPCNESAISVPEPCPFVAAQPISVDAVDVDGIDVQLPMNGTISGQFGVVGGGLPGPDLDVGITLYDAAGNALRSGYPDATGHYTIGDVAAGTYYAEVVGWRIFAQVYAGVDCAVAGQPCDPTATGTSIVMSQGENRTGIDFSAVGAQRILGRVTDAVTGLGIAGIVVDAWSAQDGLHCSAASSDLEGDYALIDNGLCTDASRVLSTDAGPSYVDEVYDGIVCPHGSAYAGACSLSGATPVAFPLAPTPSSADFALQPRDPDLIFVDGFDALTPLAARLRQ